MLDNIEKARQILFNCSADACVECLPTSCDDPAVAEMHKAINDALDLLKEIKLTTLDERIERMKVITKKITDLTRELEKFIGREWGYVRDDTHIVSDYTYFDNDRDQIYDIRRALEKARFIANERAGKLQRLENTLGLKQEQTEVRQHV